MAKKTIVKAAARKDTGTVRAAGGAKGRPKGASSRTVKRTPKDTQEEAQPPVLLSDLDDLAGTGFDQMCARYRKINELEASLKKEKGELAEQIKPLMEMVEQTAIDGGAWVAMRSKGTSPASISAELLLAKGVSMATIKACTKGGKTYEYIQVRENKA